MTTLDELLVKLRALHVWPQFVADHHADILTPRQIENLYEVGNVSHEAADALEAAARENERLREALAPFASVADEYDDREDDGFEVWKDAGPIRTIRSTFKLGMYRIARNALSGGPQND